MESPHTPDKITPPSPKTEQLTCFKRNTGVKRVGVFSQFCWEERVDVWLFQFYCGLPFSPITALKQKRELSPDKENSVHSVNAHSTEKGNHDFDTFFLRRTWKRKCRKSRELLPARQFSAAAAWSCSPSQCEASCSAPRSVPLSWASWAPSWPSCDGSSTAGTRWLPACGGSAAAPASPARASGWPRTCAPAASAGGKTHQGKGVRAPNCTCAGKQNPVSMDTEAPPAKRNFQGWAARNGLN